MARLTAPLLSFSAAGQVAKSQVYAAWRGIPYARRYVTPANPNTSGQQSTRTIFTWLNETWKLLSSSVMEPWTAFAKGKPFIDRNAWISKNLPSLRTGSDLSTILASPGTGGGPAMDSMTVTPGSGTVALTPGVPALPTGWSVVQFVGVAWLNEDPHSTTDYVSTSGLNATDPYTVNLTLAAGDYAVSGFLKYLKPDGTNAYSIATTSTTTVT